MGLANQAVTPGRTSLLEAVNICLAVIGEAPINTLETQQVGEAAQAERTLLEYHKEGQTRGWSWNRERSVPFYPDADSREVLIPASVVKWAPHRLEWNNRFQARGSRVYDNEQRSYAIPETIASIEADIVSLLPWDDCPEVFNRWACIRAARVFSNRAVGNTATYQLTQADEDQAWADLLRVDTEQGQPNAITGEAAWATFRPAMGLGRRRGGGGGWSGYDGSSLVDLGGTGTGSANLPQALGQEASPTFAGLTLSAFSTFTGQLCVLGTNGAVNPLPLGSGLSIVNGALVAAGGGGGGASLSDATPQALGTAAAGTASTASRSDHRHAMPTANQVGADATGTAAAAVAAHAAAADPHPTYTTQSEAAAAAPVQSVAGRTGAVTLVAADVSGAVSTSDSRLIDAREWSAATVTQTEAETGSSTTRLAFTPLRVFQAIAAWWAASAAKTKLDGIASGATANSSDATLLARANHTGTQTASTITGLATVSTSGAYADLSGRPTLGTAAAAASTAFAASGAVTGSGLTVTSSRVIGRSTAGTGAPEEISVGAGLSLSGGVLSVTGGGATNIWIPAAQWIPATTNGCGINSLETTTNKVNYDVLEFDSTTSEQADCIVTLPNNWSYGTVTARFYWTAASGSGGVVFQLAGLAYGDNIAIDTAMGTAQSVADTLQTVNNMHVSAATAAITIAGTPAANKPVQFQIKRLPADASDTLLTDARLIGVEVIF